MQHSDRNPVQNSKERGNPTFPAKEWTTCGQNHFFIMFKMGSLVEANHKTESLVLNIAKKISRPHTVQKQ